MPYRIEIVDGPDQGLSCHISPSRAVTVGRSPGAGILLHDRAASRIHCVLSVEGDHVQVEDLASTNGTFLGEDRVSEVVLAPGDVLRVGSSELRVVREEEPLSEDTARLETLE